MKKTFIGLLATAFLAGSLWAAPAPAAAPFPAPAQAPVIPSDKAVPTIVQPDKYEPHLEAPAELCRYSTELWVCPGAPVVLNAVLVPPPQVWVGSYPSIRFEVVEGPGAFGPFESIHLSPLGWFDRLKAWFKWKRNPKTYLDVKPVYETGSAAAVFYPGGSKEDIVRLRAVSADPTKNLGSVNFEFKMGENKAGEMEKTAAQGLEKERALDKINFHWIETIVMSSPRDNFLAKGKVERIDRVYGRDTYDTVYLSTGEKKSARRRPYDLNDNPYMRIYYWGETADAYIASKGDPDPPGPNGAMMLYFYNKKTGLLQQMRSYSIASCVNGHFLWHQGTSGYWFSTQILKKTWSPVHDLWEDMSLLRDDIRILE